MMTGLKSQKTYQLQSKEKGPMDLFKMLSYYRNFLSTT